MVGDYVRDLYAPAAQSSRALAAGGLAASVTTRSPAISLADGRRDERVVGQRRTHSEMRTSSSLRVSSGAAERRSSASAASSSLGTPSILQRAEPKLSTSPSSSTRRATGRPFTRVPLRDNPRSAM